MTQFGYNSFSEPLNSGVDFYTADMAILIDSNLSIESNVSVSAIKLSLAVSNTTVESDLAAVAVKIAFAVIDIAVDGATLTLGTKVKEASCVMSIESEMQADSIKISLSSALLESSGSLVSSAIKESIAGVGISVESDLISSAIKTSFANSDAAITSSLVSAAILVKNISASLSSAVSITVAGKISLANIHIALQNVGTLSVQPMVLFSTINANSVLGSTIDGTIYRTVILLDNKPLTNHNRKLDMSVEPIFTETVNWNNRKKRYFKSTNRAGRRTFNISWSWLPNAMEQTADNQRGRDFIKLVASDPRGHVLKIINLDESGTTAYSETSYNVLVKDYNETLIRRDLPNNVYFWDCSMSLEEV